MSKSVAAQNREAAEALRGNGLVKTDPPPKPAPFPELALQRQIAATKQQGPKTGLDAKPRLLKLRMQHRELTGEDGG